jgi:threonine synthase
LPAKFEETIVEALGRQPERPKALEGIENLPQRVVVMDANVDTLKAFISANI